MELRLGRNRGRMDKYYKVLKDALTEWGWKDEVKKADEKPAYIYVAAGVDIEPGVEYKVYLEAIEDDELLKIYVYFPYQLPKSRRDLSIFIANDINCGLYEGHFQIFQNSVRFHNVIDVTDCEPQVQHMTNLVNSAVATFNEHIIDVWKTLIESDASYNKISKYLISGDKSEILQDDIPNEL